MISCTNLLYDIPHDSPYHKLPVLPLCIPCYACIYDDSIVLALQHFVKEYSQKMHNSTVTNASTSPNKANDKLTYPMEPCEWKDAAVCVLVITNRRVCNQF